MCSSQKKTKKPPVLHFPARRAASLHTGEGMEPGGCWLWQFSPGHRQSRTRLVGRVTNGWWGDVGKSEGCLSPALPVFIS